MKLTKEAIRALSTVLTYLGEATPEWMHYEITIYNGKSDEKLATYDSRPRGNKDQWVTLHDGGIPQ